MGNYNIGGNSYSNPARQGGKIDVRVAQEKAQREILHQTKLKLASHLGNCTSCKDYGPARCQAARNLRSNYLIQKQALEEPDFLEHDE